MIQDIEPKVFYNEFAPREEQDDDYVFLFHDNKPLLLIDQGTFRIPQVREIRKLLPVSSKKMNYLFSIDQEGFYLIQRPEEHELEEITEPGSSAGAAFQAMQIFRTFRPKHLGFAGITAYHLNKWYTSQAYCGCCGHQMVPSQKERAMVCPDCGFIDYPKICPAVIVAVIHEDKILMTRYAGRSFKKHALIAGFCEIGESLEATVRREVMEEVGLKVKNFRYFGSQPWGFSSSLLIGFVVDLDGDDAIHLDTEELSEGDWFTRDQIEIDGENELSLTYTMMKAFKDGKL